MSDQLHEDRSNAANPRAFVQATGYVFQSVGLVLMLAGCCLWSFSGLIQGEQPIPPGGAAEGLSGARQWLHGSPAGQVLSALDLVLTVGAGVGLLAFGMGLHAEKRSSGAGAMVVTGVLALGWWASVVAAIIVAPSFARIVLNLIMAAGATVLFLLAGAGARLLRENPPEHDLNVVDDAFIAQFQPKYDELDEE